MCFITLGPDVLSSYNLLKIILTVLGRASLSRVGGSDRLIQQEKVWTGTVVSGKPY